MKYITSAIAILFFYFAVPASLVYLGVQAIAHPETSTSNYVALRGYVEGSLLPKVSNHLKPLSEAFKNILADASLEGPPGHAQSESSLKPQTPPVRILESAPTPVQNTLPPLAAGQTLVSKETQQPIDEGDSNNIPLEFADQSFTADEILSDRFNRLPEEFKVSASMKARIKFWFDVYTRYSSRFAVIHDLRHPWIIYRVVDLRAIYRGGDNKYVKDSRQRRLVSKNIQEVRGILRALSKKKSFNHLGAEEYKFYTLLQPVPGDRRKVFSRASVKVRSQTGQKDFFRKGLIASSKYMLEMEEIFARYDLPVEVTRLPLVESSFNEGAISKVGASGIWQFMPATSKMVDLRVGSAIDERNSPIKATTAAARLLLDSFRITKSWPLAITAYNHGPGGVLKAAKRVRSRNIADIVDKYETASFSFASQNFFSEFMAALYAEKYQGEIFGRLTKQAPLVAESFEVKYSMRVHTLTEIVGVTLEELKLYNPDLKRQAIGGHTFLPTGYRVRLPPGRGASLELFNRQAEEARRLVSETRHRAKT